jgi:hypothetical protein
MADESADQPPKADPSASPTPSTPVLGFVSSPAYAPVLQRAAQAIVVEASGGGAATAGLGPIAAALGTAGAAVAAGGSALLLAETIRAAMKGERTPIEVADEYYQTHFRDLWGWVKGDYAPQDKDSAKQATQRLQQATRDAQTVFDTSLATDPEQQCPANAAPQDALLPMPTDLSAGEQELWRVCTGLHDTYKRRKEISQNFRKMRIQHYDATPKHVRHKTSASFAKYSAH